MTFEQLTAAWSGSGNSMTSTEAKLLASAFLDEVRAQRKRASLGFAAVAIAFAALSFLSVAVVLSQDDLRPKHAFTFAGINGLIWSGWTAALIKHISKHRAPTTPAVPIREALQRSLKQHTLHRNHLKIIAIGLLLSTPLVALSIRQMVEVGRLTVDDLPLHLTFTLGAYLVAFACLGCSYFVYSAQELRRLESLLTDCDRDGQPEHGMQSPKTGQTPS